MDSIKIRPSVDLFLANHGEAASPIESMKERIHKLLEEKSGTVYVYWGNSGLTNEQAETFYYLIDEFLSD